MAGFTWDFPENLPFLDLDSAFLLSLSLCYPRYGWWSDPPPFCWSPTMWGCHNSTTDGYDTYDLYLIAFMGLKNTNKHNWTAPLQKKIDREPTILDADISEKRWHLAFYVSGSGDWLVAHYIERSLLHLALVRN